MSERLCDDLSLNMTSIVVWVIGVNTPLVNQTLTDVHLSKVLQLRAFTLFSFVFFLLLPQHT